MNPYNEVVVVVDADQLEKDAQEEGKKINPERDAEAISTFVKVLGMRNHRYALVSDHDERSLKAYRKSGYEIIAVNGNRQEEVTRFISQHIEMLKAGRIQHLVMVTTDGTFAVLAEEADPKITRVSVWAPAAKVDRKLTLPPNDFRDLDEMLPGSPKVSILVDFENIWYGLKKHGWSPDLKQLIAAIKLVGNEFGEIKRMTAYADWEPLGKEVQRNIQRELVQLDVDTQYLINMRGKNTADMRVANDIRDLIERGNGGREEVDVIVLATGDRDFRDIVKTAIQRGKKVIIMATKNGISHDLENAATEVRYIDEYLRVTPKPESGRYAIRPWQENVWFTLKVLTLCPDKIKAWIPVQGLEASGIDNLNDAIRRAEYAGILIRELHTDPGGHSSDSVKFIAENPVVEVVTRMAKWIPDRINYCLHQKGMPYIDSAYIAKGMTMDKTFQSWRIGQERNEVESWLELLVRAGIIVKKLQPHPTTPDHLISTWQLPQSQEENKSASESDLLLVEPHHITSPWPSLQTTAAQGESKPEPTAQSKDSPVAVWRSLLGSPA